MSKHPTHLFTYGSLMFAPVLERVAKRHYRSSAEVIHGYARYKVSGEEYPAVVATPDDPNHTLHGRVYWEVDAEDLARLDRFEGGDYARISTVTASGHPVALYVFLAREKMSQESWDPTWFEQIGMKQFLTRYPGFE
jgi:gamma-glutamylcyclotransferase (GGCT)/AIG2-like uncharacterized protein YtfP